MTKPQHMISQAPEATWTPEKIERLKVLWGAEPQISANAIGRELGLSKNSVVGKAHRLKLPGRESPIHPRRPKPLDRRAKAVQLPVPHADVPERPVGPPPAKNIGRAPVPTRRRIATLLPKSGPSPFSTCQWIAKKHGPFSDVDKCGQPTAPGRSYCAGHCARAYVGVPARENAA